MTNTKSTKRALLSSVMALFLCFAMLLGTTYAWFTDSVTSSNNIIKTGNLIVDLEVLDKDAGTWTSIKESKAAIFDYDNWEPGYVQTKVLRVQNEGTLALKWKAALVSENGVSDLAKVIDVYVKAWGVLDDATVADEVKYPTDRNLEGYTNVGTLYDFIANIETTTNGVLKAGENAYLGIAFKMQESAGNAYQGMKLGEFDLQILATQYTAESDSFDDQYDADANYTVSVNSATELISAIKNVEDGYTIALTDNITFNKDAYTELNGWYEGIYYEGDKSFTIDLNGKTITNDSAVNDYLMLFKNAGSKANTITFKNGTLEAASTAFSAVATSTSSTQRITINLENVNLIGNNSNGSIVKIRGGAVLNVKSGTVITGNDSYLGIENANATVNIYDGAKIYQNGTTSYNGCLVGVSYNGTVNVYGGYGKGVAGGFIAMTTGGTINVYGGEWIADTDGTFSGNDNVLIAQSDKSEYAGADDSVVNVYSGTFDGTYNCYGDAVGDAQINIAGGNFTKDPTTYVESGYEAIPNADGTYTVEKSLVPDGTDFVADGLYVDADGVYYITKAEGFDTMREMVAGEKAYENDGTWILYNDIDLNGVNWTPIAGFHGIFDGNDKTISNMNASFLAENEIGGRDFGIVCTIKDITFHKATITGTEGVGVVVSNGVGVTIENVKVTEATVIGTKYVGGIVGVVNKAVSTITNCSVTGSTIKAEGASANGKVGGIVGFLSVGKATGNTVTGCTISGPECIGGIAGRGGSGDGPATIYGNTVSGNTVTGTDTTTVGEQIGDSLNVKESE